MLIDNEVFILSQQDIRKVEEHRLIVLHKLMPNGELKPLNSTEIEFLLQYLQQQQNFVCQQNLLNLFKIINGNITSPINYQSIYPQPMDVSTNANENHAKASIREQLQWDKCISTSSPVSRCSYFNGFPKKMFLRFGDYCRGIEIAAYRCAAIS